MARWDSNLGFSVGANPKLPPAQTPTEKIWNQRVSYNQDFLSKSVSKHKHHCTNDFYTIHKFCIRISSLILTSMFIILDDSSRQYIWFKPNYNLDHDIHITNWRSH